MKTRHTVLAIVVASVALMLIVLPTGRRDVERHPADYPWVVEVAADGTSRVLGVSLGRSSVADAEQRFRATAELALFASPADALSLEAFFSEVTQGGLSAKVILNVAVDEAVLREMRERAGRGERTDSGATKYRLNQEAAARARAAPIWALTYVPYVDLEEAVVLQRFGEPAERIRTSPQTEHLLYPAMGLDLMLNADEREVLQYVRPADLDRLRQRLIDSTAGVGPG